MTPTTMFAPTTHLNNLVLPSKRTNRTKSDHTSFPVKVHQMLSRAEEEGYDHIVSWNPDGKTFWVRDQHQFETVVLPNFFTKQTRYRSFQRQLNFYNFRRIEKGPLEGSYGHPLCLRGNEALSHQITRSRSSSSSSYSKSNNTISSRRRIDVTTTTTTTTTTCNDEIPAVVPQTMVLFHQYVTPDVTASLQQQQQQQQQQQGEQVETEVTLATRQEPAASLEPLPFTKNDTDRRRRSTLILMEKLQFVPANFFDELSDDDDDDDEEEESADEVGEEAALVSDLWMEEEYETLRILLDQRVKEKRKGQTTTRITNKQDLKRFLKKNGSKAQGEGTKKRKAEE